MHLLTHSALLRAMGWSLFNSLWQMSLLWACYHLFLLVFKNLTARARHGLALLLLTAGFGWSIQTFISAYLFATGQPAGDWTFTTAGGGLPILHPALEYGRRLADELLPWCSTIYLLILGVLLVYYSRQYLRSRRIVREGLSPIPTGFDDFVGAIGRRMGIRATVHARLSSLVEAPVTLGFLRPMILLPVSLLTQLTTAQIEAILVHELAHIHRKDYLVNWLVTAMELLFFFNPFVRRLIAQLKKEREHCCDDAVLEYRYDPHAYVTALLSLARQQQQTGLALAAIGGGEQLLLQRARKILQQKRTDDRPGARPLILFGLTALLTLLMAGPSRPGADEQPPVKQITFQGIPFEPMSFVMIEVQPVQRLQLIRVTPTPRHSTVPHHISHGITHYHNLIDLVLTESVPVQNTAGPAKAPRYVRMIQPDDRDYSMSNANDKDNDNPAPDAEERTDARTYVPQSSFSFQYTDTLPPGEKLALLQELTQKEFRLQIIRMHQDMEQQLFLLRDQAMAIRKAAAVQNRAGMKRTPDEQLLNELLRQQTELQRQYLLNLQKLERQLQKASRHLTIVYI